LEIRWSLERACWRISDNLFLELDSMDCTRPRILVFIDIFYLQASTDFTGLIVG